MLSKVSNPANAPGTLKVFISYSRKDGVFAEEIRTALGLVGFEAYLDRLDIAPGEPWEARLGSLIHEADTVVFLLTPDSLASVHCTWEVEETSRAGKRLVPVILKDVPEASIPERLRKLNFVFFRAGESFSKALASLVDALRADADWIREHTRYGELAARWMDRGKAEALLLRGSDLADAKRWLAARPKQAPEISANQLAYIEASQKGAENELRAKEALRSRIVAGLAMAAVVLAALAALAGLEWWQAKTVSDELAKTNARLERKLGLRVGPFGNKPYDVPAGWFQIATNYTSAAAFIEATTKSGRSVTSGVIMNAKQLNPAWEERPVLVTASYVIAKDPSPEGFAARASDATLIFFGPRGEHRTVRLGQVLWQSDQLGVSISSIEGQLPEGVTMIANVNAISPVLAGLQSQTVLDSEVAASQIAKESNLLRPIVLIGQVFGRSEITLMLSHLLGVSKHTVPSTPQFETDLVYVQSTLGGSSGSAIFDAETGELLGIHLAAGSCEPSQQVCLAVGTSLSRILQAVRTSQGP